MAGRLALGELSRSQADGVSRLAPGDDAELRALLRRSVVPGAVRVAFTREPDYFAGEGLAGAVDHTVVARQAGTLVGVGRCSVHTLHRNGAAQSVGYLGELRLQGATSGAVRLLRDGYAALADACATHDVHAFFTSIATDNARARRVLEQGGRLGLPRYRALASLVTLVAPVPRRAWDTPVRLTDDEGRRPTTGDRDELSHFLEAQARPYQLTLTWPPSRWDALARHGVSEADVCVVRRGGAIVGAAALWDQRAFRQTVIDGFTGTLRLARPLVDLAAVVAGRPPLPAPGSVLAHAAVLGASVADTSHWPALWQAVQQRARRLGLSWLTLSRDARDPELPALRSLLRARVYHTTLYDVQWPHRPTGEAWDGRLVRPEAGLL